METAADLITPEIETRQRASSVLQEAFYQETLAKKTVELSFQEESAKQEQESIEMQIDAVLSDLSPNTEALLKTCAKLTSYDGPLSHMDLDQCIAKLQAEITDLEAKNEISRDEHDRQQTEELHALWLSLEKDQRLGAEEKWAENLMDSTHSLSEKSTFRDQFREMMEDAVRRAVDTERTFNCSVSVWERNFQNALNATTQTTEENLMAANRKYFSDRERAYNSHADTLRTAESVWLEEISREREYVQAKIDAVLDQNYTGLAAHCLTTNRGFTAEYQTMLKDLSEYRSAYVLAKRELLKTSEPSKMSRHHSRREQSPTAPSRHIDYESSSPEKSSTPISISLDVTMKSNLFYGKIPKKTMVFETFTRIHGMELEAIGDPAERHLALSKKLKTDYAVQSSGVLKTADAALEDLRSMYFKRIIGMRDAFVNGYNTIGGTDDNV